MKHFKFFLSLVMLLALSIGQVFAAHTVVRANEMVSGEKYIITATYNSTVYYLAPAQFSAGSTGCGSYSSELTDAAAWTFTKSGTTWTVSTVIDGKTYYLSHTNTNNGVQSTTTTANYDVSASTTGATTVKMVNNSRTLSLYQGSNWRCYTSASGVQTITLYKVAASCSAPTAPTNGSFF